MAYVSASICLTVCIEVFIAYDKPKHAPMVETISRSTSLRDSKTCFSTEDPKELGTSACVMLEKPLKFGPLMCVIGHSNVGLIITNVVRT